jgi:hypothetical protein
MFTCRLSVLALVAVAPLAFGASPVPGSSDSASELRPVTVSASKPAQAVRFDVNAACPGIGAQLQKSLTSAWGHVQETGSMRVQFHVQDNRITEVQTVAAPWDYRSYVRRAVAKLDCAVTPGQEQDFAFLLVISAPAEYPAQNQVALQIDPS